MRRGVIQWVSRGVAVSLLLVLIALPVLAQVEADRPTPPGTKPPTTVFTRLEAAGNADQYPDADHIIVLDESVNRVMENGVTYVDLHTIYKVLTEEGCTELSALRWDYDPQSSFIQVDEVSIIRDGKRIDVPLTGVQDIPAPQHMIYWGNRIKELQLPRLRVGDGIEIRAMRKGYNYALLAEGGASGTASAPRESAAQRIKAPGDDRYIPPMPGQYFDIVLFEADVPTVEKRYILTLPKDKRLISEVYNGPLYTRTDYTPDSTLYTWWAFDMPAVVDEERQPDESDFVPKVVMTTAESWQAKSRWFFDVNKNQFTVTDAIKKKVQEILKDAGVENGTDMQKATVLNHWVAQNIRYSGQTMGEGEGFTLHPSTMIFEQRSGVCKDIASMSITFLRAAGLTTYPAMTLAGGRIEDIPADQFNHCVVAWKRKDGSFTMLDPTWVPFNNDIWSKLETEQYFDIGSPKGEDLMQIRYSPPEESPMKVIHKAELDENGTLTGSIEIHGSGASDSRLRRVVYQKPKHDLTESLAKSLARISDRVVIQSVTHRDVEDFSGDMWIKLTYTIPGYAMNVDGGLEFNAPALNAVKSDYLFFRANSIEWPEERKTDVFLYYTQQLDVNETIKLPSGWKLANEPSIDPVDATYADFSGAVTQTRKGLEIKTLADVRRRQIPPSGYAGFRQALTQLDDWAGKTIRVTKGGK